MLGGREGRNKRAWIQRHQPARYWGLRGPPKAGRSKAGSENTRVSTVRWQGEPETKGERVAADTGLCHLEAQAVT